MDKKRFFCLLVSLAMLLLGGCATCKTLYKPELTPDPRLAEANASYRKALHWIGDGQCALTDYKAHEAYITAESYLSDTIFKLKRLGSKYNIDVKQDVEYCEQVKGEIHAKEGKVRP